MSAQEIDEDPVEGAVTKDDLDAAFEELKHWDLSGAEDYLSFKYGDDVQMSDVMNQAARYGAALVLASKRKEVCLEFGYEDDSACNSANPNDIMILHNLYGNCEVFKDITLYDLISLEINERYMSKDEFLEALRALQKRVEAL